MVKRKQVKRPTLPSNVDADIAIADVPVKISFYHGDLLLDEYDDVIDLEFHRRLENGGVLGAWISELYRKGYSTEDALFTIASELVKEQAVESVQSLTGSELLKKAAGRDIHVNVKRNWEITYKRPYKE